MFERHCQPLHQYKREGLLHDPLKNVNASGGAKQTALYPVRFCLLSNTEQKENEDVSHDCTFATILEGTWSQYAESHALCPLVSTSFSGYALRLQAFIGFAKMICLDSHREVLMSLHHVEE
jgi:hypothetical protein